MTDDVIDTSYEPFSREPEYIEANRAFIQTLTLDPTMHILDLACGTGTMTDLMLEKIRQDQGTRKDSDGPHHNGLSIIGLDLSRESLLLAQEHMATLADSAGRLPPVSLFHGTADCLPIADQSINFSIMGNAIHMIEDLDAMFSELHRVLKPGGQFAFNASFYAGTYVSGTEHVYRQWMQDAIAFINRRDVELRAAGQPGVKRKRGKAAKAFSRPWLSIEEFTQQMGRHGLIVRETNERTVMLTQRSFETIGSYAGLAVVLLSGYPVKLACEALEQAAGPALRTAGVTEVPRNWLEMVAEKAPSTT